MLLLDTDIASAFAKAGHFGVIIKLFGKVGITTAVYEELLSPLTYGYDYPEVIFKNAGLVTLSAQEQKEYLSLKKENVKIGRGEIESIVVCLNRGYLFSSFDKKAILVASSMGVNVITAGVILKGLIVKNIATREEVLKIIRDIEKSDNRVMEMEL